MGPGGIHWALTAPKAALITFLPHRSSPSVSFPFQNLVLTLFYSFKDSGMLKAGRLELIRLHLKDEDRGPEAGGSLYIPISLKTPRQKQQGLLC